ncbi:MAG TPA: hypothetical protein VLX44_11655 [Xanthobacteraceae bacterium]|nr:hypothetical protein [Xanthobacteraceae bacterium]
MSRAWRIFTGNLVFFLAVPFIIYVITFVGALVLGLSFFLAGWATGSFVLMTVAVFLAFVVILTLTLVGQGVLLFGAFQRLRGQPLRIGEAVQRVMNRFVPLAGLVLLWGLAFLIGFTIFTAVVSATAASVGAWVLMLMPLVFVLGIILAVMWIAAVPACIVEGLGPIASMSRSADLSKGFRWRIFGILALLFLLLLAGTVVQVILGTVSSGLASVVGFVWSVVWAAYFNCAIIMTYHDLRVAKEGVDTEQIASVFD